MAPIAKQAWTVTAPVRWSGELAEVFRSEVDRIFGTTLTDEAWHDLNRVTFAYSFFLNREVAAASLVDQKKTVASLLSATDALLDNIGSANTSEMGHIVTNRIAEKWDEIYDHGAEHDRHTAVILSDIKYILEVNGHPAAQEQADQCISDWTSRGMLVRPSGASDFIVLLREFREAVSLLGSGLQAGTEPYEEAGRGWIEFVGQLTAWAKKHGLSSWASHSEQFGGAGPFTDLVKAINRDIPELRDSDGRLADKQMRRPGIADASLAKSINEARKTFERLREPKTTGDT